jgi:outer membrane protein OmpA-like peptidoglycan-associated protein
LDLIYRVAVSMIARVGRHAPWLAAVVLSASAGPAAAQGFDAERFVPAVGGESQFTVEHPATLFHLGYALGLFVDLADDPVIERDTATGEIVSRPLDLSLSTNLVASLGLFDRAELGLHLPVHLIYSGDDFAGGGVNLSASGGLGDLRFVPKLTLWGGGDAEQHALLGVALPLSFPTGDDVAMRGSGGFSVEPRLLFAAHFGALGLAANLGYRWRSEHPPALPIGDEVALGLAGSYALAPALSLDAELYGGKQVATEPGDGDFMLEILGGATWRATERLRVHGGLSFGVLDGLGEPDFRAIVGIRYAVGAPERHGFGDTDGDGIIDREDDCYDEPEDEDGFADTDGCPDADNDRDGILDGDDECPDLPEERGGDGDGCPSKTYVEIADGKIEIFGKVRFATGSDKIRADSEPLLDQIAAALEGNPNIRKVRIEGHTDSVGGEEINRDLSERRARSVRSALVRRGIDEDRLEARGYGESNPIAPNKTAAGRAKNRRVEFVVVE